jgi:UDP-glucose 4-epimerase
VFEVIEADKRAAGRPFAVRLANRRAGDPVSLVADVRRIHAALKWSPQFDDLDTIVAHALAWERRLQEAGKRAERQAIPA